MLAHYSTAVSVAAPRKFIIPTYNLATTTYNTAANIYNSIHNINQEQRPLFFNSQKAEGII